MTANINDVKASIEMLIRPPEEENLSQVDDKIAAIRTLLDQHPSLKSDEALVREVVHFSTSSKNPIARQFRQALLLKEESGIVLIQAHDPLPANEEATLMRFDPEKGHFDAGRKFLTISVEALSELKVDAFWQFIERHGAERLVVRQEDKAFEYGAHILKQLVKEKPPLAFLTERVTLKSDGDDVSLTKATLLLCGDYFKTMLLGGFEESRKDTIDLPVSHDAFMAILRKVETGRRDPLIPEDEYIEASDYLLFSPFSLKKPAGAFGKEEWEKYFGDVGEPPPVLDEFVEALERACPFFPGKVSETSVYGLMPKEVDGKPWCLNAADEWLQKITEGRVKLNWNLAKQEHGNTPVEKPYWFLMTKDVMGGSRGKTRAQQLAMANIEGYEAPKLLEAVTAILMHYVSSGDKKTRLFRDDPWTFTCCQELIYGSRGIVGRFLGSVLDVSTRNIGDVDVGVAPLRKFLGT